MRADQSKSSKVMRSSKPACWQRLPALIDGWGWLPFVLQSQHQNTFDAPHIDQVEAQRSGAGRLEALGCVAFGQAQQLLALAQFGPGKGSLQQPLGELA